MGRWADTVATKFSTKGMTVETTKGVTKGLLASTMHTTGYLPLVSDYS